MAESSLAVFESLSKEFRCDADGRGFISRRGLARMCGVKHNSWGQGGSGFTKEIDEIVAQQGFVFEDVVVKGIPDTIAAIVILHYAQAGKETAQKSLMAFAAYGLRKAIQDVVGYVGPQASKKYSIADMLHRKPEPWERMFSQEWIKEAEKLTGWKWSWQCMGQFINDCVYAYMPTDVVDALRELNPKGEDGRRHHKHHQFLKPEIRDRVGGHLKQVHALMEVSDGNMELFQAFMTKKYGSFKLPGQDNMPLFKTETVFLLRSS